VTAGETANQFYGETQRTISRVGGADQARSVGGTSGHGGYPPATTPADAIEQDWLGVLLIGTSDAAEALRYTAPEDERERRRLLRKALALVVATCEEWEKRI